jgi:hypothetical protein
VEARLYYFWRVLGSWPVQAFNSSLTAHAPPWADLQLCLGIPGHTQYFLEKILVVLRGIIYMYMLNKF